MSVTPIGEQLACEFWHPNVYETKKFYDTSLLIPVSLFITYLTRNLILMNRFCLLVSLFVVITQFISQLQMTIIFIFIQEISECSWPCQNTYIFCCIFFFKICTLNHGPKKLLTCHKTFALARILEISGQPHFTD